MSLRYIDVCSGISAPTAAWKPLGWQALCYAEIEAAPRAVLQHHYPDVPLVGDFTQIEGTEYGPVDLLVGGTPCQSFSIAGLRGGLADDRGNLALEFLKLAGRARPRWVVWENVPGVLSSLSHDAPDFGPPDIDLDAGDGPGDGEEIVVEDQYDADEDHAFACFLAGLQELGYGAAYRVLDAQYAGVPQRRRRVFVVGYLGDWRRAAAVLFERHGMSGHPAPRREARERVASPIAAGSPRSGCRNDADTADNLISATVSSKWAKGSGGPSGDECQNLLAVPFASIGNGEYSPGCGTMRAKGADCGGGSETLIAFDTTQVTSASNYSNPKPGDPCHPLAAGMHPPAVAFSIMPMNSGKDYKARETDVAQPIMAGGPVGGNQGGDFVIRSGVRRLTPRECERLQGFPDDFTLTPYRGRMMADGPRYKMLGNSMAVPVMEWIGKRIMMVESALTP